MKKKQGNIRPKSIDKSQNIGLSLLKLNMAQLDVKL